MVRAYWLEFKPGSRETVALVFNDDSGEAVKAVKAVKAAEVNCSSTNVSCNIFVIASCSNPSRLKLRFEKMWGKNRRKRSGGIF